MVIGLYTPAMQVRVAGHNQFTVGSNAKDRLVAAGHRVCAIVKLVVGWKAVPGYVEYYDTLTY